VFYCDPPYWQTEGYGVNFGWSEYEALLEAARRIQGTMIISINDHPDIRKLFNDLPCVEVGYQYTIGGAGKTSDCIELIYGTWPDGIPTPKRYQQSLF